MHLATVIGNHGAILHSLSVQSHTLHTLRNIKAKYFFSSHKNTEPAIDSVDLLTLRWYTLYHSVFFHASCLTHACKLSLMMGETYFFWCSVQSEWYSYQIRRIVTARYACKLSVLEMRTEAVSMQTRDQTNTLSRAKFRLMNL